MKRQRRQAGSRRGQSKPKRKAGSRKQSSGQWVNMAVVKPLCTPTKAYLMQILPPYAVEYKGYREHVMNTTTGAKIPCGTSQVSICAAIGLMGGLSVIGNVVQCGTFKVKKEQANWATYLIERSQKLEVIKGTNIENNRRTGRRYGGWMPTRWRDKEGNLVTDVDCDVPSMLEGVDGVQKVKEAPTKANGEQPRKPQKRSSGLLGMFRS